MASTKRLRDKMNNRKRKLEEEKKVEERVEEEEEEVVDEDVQEDEEMEDEDVQDEEDDAANENEEQAENETEGPSRDLKKEEDDFVHPEEKQKKSGVIYFPMIPPKFNKPRLRHYFEKLAPGQVGRIYLASKKQGGSMSNRYSEGWMELKSKKTAKAIAREVDNTHIGGKTRDFVSTMLWNIRYLSGFKWVHLMEQLRYEREVEKRRMNVEVAHARRVAEQFEEQVEKGKHLRKLEAKVKAAGGQWNDFEREVQQKQVISKQKGVKKARKANTVQDGELLNMIFK